MRAKYSGKIFVKLYPHMVQECFFDGHMEAFAYYDGVFDKLVYDNLKTAVKKVLVGRDRIEQTTFSSFKAYYNYESVFCNRGKGSEKGGVEGLVGYSRRNFLVPIPKCKSFEEINKLLLDKCIRRDDSTTGTMSYNAILKVFSLIEVIKASIFSTPIFLILNTIRNL